MTAVAPSRRPARTPRDALRIGLWIALLMCVVTWTLPLVFIIFTSLKTPGEIFTTSALVPPAVPQWGNYATAAESGHLLRVAGNSLVIAIIKVPIGLAISASAAFALSRLRFRWQRLVLGIIAIGSMLPVQVALAPLFGIMLNAGLLNHPLGVILPYIGFGLPYTTFILYGFFKSIPRELDESARMDGASNFRLFWQIVLPLSKPALAAMFILNFVGTWNEFGIALVILQDKASWTVPLAIQGFQSEFTADYGPLNAFTIMTIIPVLIVYLLFQRYFVSGMFSGALKG